MKTLKALLWSASLLRLSDAAFEAQIYIPGVTKHTVSNPPLISPNTARLLLAQRLGLAQYHELGDAKDSELSILNEHGGKQEPLFAEQKGSIPRLLILEGIQHPNDLITTGATPDLLIQNPPLSEATQQLAKTLQGQISHQSGNHVSARSAVEYISSLKDLSRTDPTYKPILNDLKALVRQHLKSDHATILITPPFKHADPSSTYGSYTPAHHLSRRDSPEAVLSNPPSTLQEPPADSDSPGSSKPENPTTRSPGPLPHGVLKICHPSLESTINATNNCSGHGVPYKRSSAGGDDEASKDCYACKCTATVTTTEDGKKKTVKWGGPACQKKDVSTPFWLLAGLTVFLVAVVSWAISLLVSIGQEELPGVIGAGVAGPRAQK